MILDIYNKKGIEAVVKYLESVAINEDTLNNAIQITQILIKNNLHHANKINKIILKLFPFDTTVHLNQAFIEYGLKNFDKTLFYLEKMFLLSFNISDALNAANLLIRFNKFDRIEGILDNYFDEAKKDFLLIEPLMYLSLKLAKWDYVDEIIMILENEYVKENFEALAESPRTHLLWCENEIFNNKVALTWSKSNFPFVETKKIQALPLANRKIKIAYLSSDFKDHPTTYLIKGLLKNHNKNIFELYMFNTNINEKYESKNEVESYFDFIYQIKDKTDEEAANLIRELNIDVLIDLNGPTKDNRLGILAFRSAPLQLSYLAYPGSIGGRIVDYIIGDSYTIQEHLLPTYSENVIKIEETYQINDYASKLPLEKVIKSDFNFSKKTLVLGVFNAVNKIRSEVWLTWMHILKKVPSSVIWILDPGEIALKNILRVTKNAKIDPKRVVIAKRVSQDEHLKRIQICDLMLDTWPYSGHTSTSDALFAKVPVLTKEGKNFTCRVSGGLLKAAGFEELIAKDVNEYKTKAIELLKDKKQLKNLQLRLKKEIMKSDIFNAKSKTLQIEQALVTALTRQEQNLPQLNINMKKPEETPLYTIVTVCKNRLEHIKQSLPFMAKQKNCEVIVVDYNCPQKCGEWVKKNFPEVKVVKTDDPNEFCVAKGRNLGASQAKGEYILFSDADMLLKKDFSQLIIDNDLENNFYQIASFEDSSMAGTVIVSKKNFFETGCYDEAYVGWGGEDDDLYIRLNSKNIRRKTFHEDYIEAIIHGDEIRQFGENEELLQNKLQAHKVNSMYRRIKYDLENILNIKELNFEMRKNLMQNIKNQIKSLSLGNKEARIEIASPPAGIYNLNRTLVYTME